MKKTLLAIFLILTIARAFAQETGASEITLKDAQSVSFAARENVVIYPNPVTGATFKVKGGKISSVELLNVIGKTVRFLKNDLENNEIIVKVSDLDKGMYLVKITFFDKKSIIKKLLIK